MSVNLTIRDLPEETRDTLRQRAEARRQSLNSYIVDLLEREAGLPTMSEWVDMVESRARLAGSSDAAVEAVRELRDALASSTLDETTAAEAHAQIAEIDAAFQEPQPDRRRVAHRLEQLTRMLADAGSLTTASAALIGPLHTLAGWLGALGAPILSMLPG